MRTMRWLAICTLLASFAVGCGEGGSSALNVATGRVMLDGQPVAGARVTLHPDEGTEGATVSTGVTDDSGVYQLKSEGVGGKFRPGAEAGEYTAVVSKLEASSDDDSQLETMPSLYAHPDTSPLKVTIVGGTNEVPTFELETTKISKK